MIDQKKRTHHFETSSLLPLKSVLIKAERETPPHALHEQKDVTEELASKLIASMKKKYRKAMSLRGAFVPSTARDLYHSDKSGGCATKQSSVNQETLAPHPPAPCAGASVSLTGGCQGDAHPPRTQVPGSADVALLTTKRFARNDIKIEP